MNQAQKDTLNKGLKALYSEAWTAWVRDEITQDRLNALDALIVDAKTALDNIEVDQ